MTNKSKMMRKGDARFFPGCLGYSYPDHVYVVHGEFEGPVVVMGEKKFSRAVLFLPEVEPDSDERERSIRDLQERLRGDGLDVTALEIPGRSWFALTKSMGADFPGRKVMSAVRYVIGMLVHRYPEGLAVCGGGQLLRCVEDFAEDVNVWVVSEEELRRKLSKCIARPSMRKLLPNLTKEKKDRLSRASSPVLTEPFDVTFPSRMPSLLPDGISRFVLEDGSITFCVTHRPLHWDSKQRRRLCLYYHGNAESALCCIPDPFLRLLTSPPYSLHVLVPEYRGYHPLLCSSPVPSQAIATIPSDVRSCINGLVAPDEEIALVYGRSMGSVSACFSCIPSPDRPNQIPRCIALESGFSDEGLCEFGGGIKLKIPSLCDTVRSYTGRVGIFHAKDDRVVRYDPNYLQMAQARSHVGDDVHYLSDLGGHNLVSWFPQDMVKALEQLLETK